jgi:hypothetical protein
MRTYVALFLFKCLTPGGEPFCGRLRPRVRALGRGALLPARAAACGLGGAFFRARDFGRCYISLLLLADNYNRTTTNITAEAQSTRRTNGRRRLLLRSSAFFSKCLQISRLRGSANSAALRLIIVAGESKLGVTKRNTQRQESTQRRFEAIPGSLQLGNS